MDLIYYVLFIYYCFNLLLHTFTDKKKTPTESIVKNATIERCTNGNFTHSEQECSKYFYCLNETWHERTCYYGTHWNRKLKICDDPDYAECDPNRTRPRRNFRKPKPDKLKKEGITKALLGAAVQREHILEATTSGKVCEPGQYQKRDCKFYMDCRRGKWVRMFCPQGTFWNEKINKCEDALRVPECTNFYNSKPSRIIRRTDIVYDNRPRYIF